MRIALRKFRCSLASLIGACPHSPARRHRPRLRLVDRGEKRQQTAAMNRSKTTLIAADVGGTNARLALAQRSGDGAVVLSDARTYGCADYDSLGAIVHDYRERFPDAAISG